MEILRSYIEKVIEENFSLEQEYQIKHFLHGFQSNFDHPQKGKKFKAYVAEMGMDGIWTIDNIKLKYGGMGVGTKDSPIVFFCSENALITYPGGESYEMEPEEKPVASFEIWLDVENNKHNIVHYHTIFKDKKPEFITVVAIDQIANKIVEQIKEKIGEKSLEEYNALGTGAVVGYTGPLGMDTRALHKAFWSGDKKRIKKGAKTASTSLKESNENYWK